MGNISGGLQKVTETPALTFSEYISSIVDGTRAHETCQTEDKGHPSVLQSESADEPEMLCFT